MRNRTSYWSTVLIYWGVIATVLSVVFALPALSAEGSGLTTSEQSLMVASEAEAIIDDIDVSPGKER